MKFFADRSDSKWGPGTWVLLMIILIISSTLSFYLRNLTNSFLLYLSISVSIVMIHWFGLRVLFLSYVNAIFTLVIWNAPGEWWYIMLSGFREPLLAFSSWFFCQNIVRHSKGLSDTFSFARFTVLGVLLPDIVNTFFTYHYTFVNGDLERVALIWLSDFITIICVAIPLLHFFQPVTSGKLFKLVRHDNGEAHLTEGKRIAVVELVIITL